MAITDSITVAEDTELEVIDSEVEDQESRSRGKPDDVE